MGRGYAYKCPDCGYSFTVLQGHGVLDERVYMPNQYDLLAEMFDLGKECFPVNSIGASVTVSSRSLGRCPDCGQYKTLAKKTVEFLPEGKAKQTVKKIGNWKCIRGTRFIRQSNRCDFCNALVDRIPPKEIADNMICPHCHIRMEHTGDLMWD